MGTLDDGCRRRDLFPAVRLARHFQGFSSPGASIEYRLYTITITGLSDNICNAFPSSNPHFRTEFSGPPKTFADRSATCSDQPTLRSRRGALANWVFFARAKPSSNKELENTIVMHCHRSCANAKSVIVRPAEIRSRSRVVLLDDLMNHRTDQFTMLLEVAQGEIEYQVAAFLVGRYFGFVESRRLFLSPATANEHSQVFLPWAKVYEGPGSDPVRQAYLVLVVVQFMLRLGLPIDDLQNRIGELDD